jgi:uncharacterized membrane protein
VITGARAPAAASAKRWLLWGLLALAAAASAGAAPWVNALAGARAPIDFARDFTAARALARGDRQYAINADVRNVEAEAAGIPTVPVHGGPYLPHPPPATVLLLPLTALSFAGASAAWWLLSLLALVWLAHNLLRAATPERPVTAPRTATLTIALLLWPPVLHNLEKGQWSILLAALMAAAWRATAERRSKRAGVWIGLGACLKVMPGVVIPFFAVSPRHRRAAFTAVATAIAVAVAALPLTGWSPWFIFVAQSRPNVRALETWYANTASLHGLWARLFIGGAYARPWLTAPMAGAILQIATSAALLAVALAATARRRRALSPAAERAQFALWVTLAVLLNPLAWAHTLVLLALPLALLIADGASIGLGVAVVLLSIPKETLYRLAGPPPASGAGACALSIHAIGALVVFAIAAGRAWRDDRSSASSVVPGQTL